MHQRLLLLSDDLATNNDEQTATEMAIAWDMTLLSGEHDTTVSSMDAYILAMCGLHEKTA